jgi:hypothetical protein
MKSHGFDMAKPLRPGTGCGPTDLLAEHFGFQYSNTPPLHYSASANVLFELNLQNLV